MNTNFQVIGLTGPGIEFDSRLESIAFEVGILQFEAQSASRFNKLFLAIAQVALRFKENKSFLRFIALRTEKIYNSVRIIALRTEKNLVACALLRCALSEVEILRCALSD